MLERVRLVSPLFAAVAATTFMAAQYPGVDARAITAEATVRDGWLRLQNGKLALQWQVKDGRLRPLGVIDKWSNAATPAGGEAFLLLGADGRTIAASELAVVGEPRSEQLVTDDRSLRARDHVGGERIVATLASRDGALRVEWQVSLRNGSNYVRQELKIEPQGKDLALAEIVPVDLPAAGARQAGEVPGSPVVAGNLFFACESPLAENRLGDGRVRCCRPCKRTVKAGESVVCGSVVGAAAPGQMRRAFLGYIERERPRPYRPFLHYNSWYDIAWVDRKFDEQQSLKVIELFGRELIERRGVVLDSFVFDDGWDDDRTLWGFHKGFPNGFTPIRAAAEKYHSAVGTWLSPWGGYNEAKDRRLRYGREQGFETNANGFSLAGPKYYARFRRACVEMIEKYGVNYFKFDGVGGGNTDPGKPYARPGPEATADLEALLRLTADLRRARPELFVNITTGTWPSPFWLLHCDSIWRNGNDSGCSGEGSKRQQWINYRDAVTRQMVVARGPLFPLNSIMNQGIMVAKEAANLGADLKDMKDEFRMFFADGTQIQELYMTPQMMTPAVWDALAEAARWSRANADVLVDTHWIGGDVDRGEVYGYASWSPRKGIVALRNPSSKPAAYVLDVAKALELPPDAPRRYLLKSPWKEDAARPAITVSVGQGHRFQLKPFEALVLEATSTD
jgi:hypothetical protein